MDRSAETGDTGLYDTPLHGDQTYRQFTSFGLFCIQILSDIDLLEIFDHGKTLEREGKEREENKDWPRISTQGPDQMMPHS